MERIMSTEEKIKRAEEIYNRRKSNHIMTGTTKVNISEKKDIKLFKKMIIQIIVCLAIYSLFYIVKNNNYIFSEDFINKTKEVLAYDVNFQEIYSKLMEKIPKGPNNSEEINKDENKQETEQNIESVEKSNEENGIGGAEKENEETNNEDIIQLSQMEQDALSIKNSISFIKPIEGTITSKFGWRNPSTVTVPKYHTGLDIANIAGTKIKSATDGDVILSSSTGDYRKPFKNTNSGCNNYLCTLQKNKCKAGRTCYSGTRNC